MSSNNRINDAKEINISVIVRARPLTYAEEKRREGSPFDLKGNAINRVSHTQKGAVVSKSYQYDTVYGPDSTQPEIFTKSIQPIVDEVLKGFNCTIFAYGQTGTGKTYTMEGASGAIAASTSSAMHPHAGIIPRAAHYMFNYLEEHSIEFTARVSFLELYNEELQDLLAATEGAKDLHIYAKVGNDGGTAVVQNLEEIAVSSAGELTQLLEKGLKQRTVAATNMNDKSSRSHCLFTVTLHLKETTLQGEELMKIGKLNLVDLAGSESIGKVGNDRQKETKNINKSLLTLGRVINSLTEKQQHVPYRDSKLTRLLQDSLGGKTKTLIVATISTSLDALDETSNTLDYAARAKCIKNKPEVNAKQTKKVIMKEYTDQIRKLQLDLAAARSNEGFFLSLETYNEYMSYKDSCANMEERMKSIQDKMNERIAELKLTKDELAQMGIVLEDTKERLVKTTDQYEKTQESLDIMTQEEEKARKEIGRYVVQEANLMDQNKSIKQTLNAAYSDNTGLFAKIDRKANVEKSNKEQSQTFLEEVTAQTEEARSELENFAQQQSQVISAINNSIQQTVSSNSQNMNSMSKQIQQVFASVTEIENNFTSVINSSRAQSTSEWDGLREDAVGTRARAERSMENLTNNIKTILSTLQNQLNEHQQGVATWAEEQRSVATEALKSFKTFSEKHNNSVSAFTTDVRSVTSESTTRAATSDATTDAYVAQRQAEREALQAEQAKMFAEFTAKLTADMNARMSAFCQVQAQADASLVKGIRSNTSYVSDALGGLANRANEFQSSVASYVGESEKKTEESSNVFTSKLNTLEERSSNETSQISTVLRGHRAFVEEVSVEVAANEAARAASLDNHNKNALSLLENATSATSSTIEKSQVQTASLQKQIEQQQTKTLADLSSSASSLTQQASSHAFKLQEHTAKVVEEVLEVQVTCSTYISKLKEDVPTGKTPAKKEAREFSHIESLKSEVHPLMEITRSAEPIEIEVIPAVAVVLQDTTNMMPPSKSKKPVSKIPIKRQNSDTKLDKENIHAQ